MFDIGLQEMVVIGVIALLVFGPSKLPELGRMVGRAMREFRRASDEFRSTVESNLHINDPEPVIAPAAEAPHEPAAPLSPEREATPAGAQAEPQPDPAHAGESAEPYCAQRGARLLHRRACAWVGRIPDAERIYFKQVADARDQGLVECPVCEPWD